MTLALVTRRVTQGERDKVELNHFHVGAVTIELEQMLARTT